MLKRSILLTLLCYFAGTAIGQTSEREANLKAVFIYNFTRYIDWDVNNSDGEFIIGIIGSSAVYGSLIEIAKTNTVDNKKIVIKTFNRPEEISNCQILFIPKNIPFSLESILTKIGKGILTVSEETGYAKLGTAFNFIIVNSKLKFEANLRSIYSAGLRASSQLLKLATIVD